MSRKYIKQIDNNNFIYPNYKLAEYDIDIIHDLNENSVTGTVTNFTTSLSNDKKSLTISFDYQWVRNGAEVFVLNDNTTSIISFHMILGDTFFKPNQTIFNVSVTGATPNTVTDSISVVETFATPEEIWYEGDYFYEVRFIGHRAIYPVLGKFNITYPVSPTPTPTMTPTVTPTPGLTQSPTPTPTKTVTPTPTSGGGNNLAQIGTVCSAGDGCTTGTILRVYLDNADYATYVANGYTFAGFGGGAPTTCTAIARNNVGSTITGYFLDEDSVCWKLTAGNFTYNSTQC